MGDLPALVDNNGREIPQSVWDPPAEGGRSMQTWLRSSQGILETSMSGISSRISLQRPRDAPEAPHQETLALQTHPAFGLLSAVPETGVISHDLSKLQRLLLMLPLLACFWPGNVGALLSNRWGASGQLLAVGYKHARMYTYAAYSSACLSKRLFCHGLLQRLSFETPFLP